MGVRRGLVLSGRKHELEAGLRPARNSRPSQKFRKQKTASRKPDALSSRPDVLLQETLCQPQQLPRKHILASHAPGQISNAGHPVSRKKK